MSEAVLAWDGETKTEGRFAQERGQRAVFLRSNFNRLASQKDSRCLFPGGRFSNLCSFGTKCCRSNDFCGATFCDGGTLGS